jgi:hypothetical protein
MALVVVGGQARNVGKTCVVAAIVAAMPERRWTAIKLTQHSHGLGTDEKIGVHVETDAGGRTDSSRYLAAGAARSLWVRMREGETADAVPLVLAEVARAENAIVESNGILDFLEPDVFVMVVDPAVAEFKASALRLLERADLVLMRERGVKENTWDEGLRSTVAARRVVKFGENECYPAGFDALLRQNWPD